MGEAREREARPLTHSPLPPCSTLCSRWLRGSSRRLSEGTLRHTPGCRPALVEQRSELWGVTGALSLFLAFHQQLGENPRAG
jgi:hypothetical protein